MRSFSVEGIETRICFEQTGEMFTPKIIRENDSFKIPLLLEDYQVEYMMEKVLNQIQERYYNMQYFYSVITGAARYCMIPKKFCLAR